MGFVRGGRATVLSRWLLVSEVVLGGGYEPRDRHKQELMMFISFMMAGILRFLQGLSSQILFDEVGFYTHRPEGYC